jgi:hypothetical protein
MIIASDITLKHEVPGHLCPYCLKPVGYLGRFFSWLFGAGIHKCDFLNVDAEANRLRERLENAEDDVLRLHQEKMDLWERAFAAEKALEEARDRAFEEAADYLDLLAANYDRMSENVWLTKTAKRLYASFHPRYLEAASSIRSRKSGSSQSVENIAGDRE